jgi:methylenetetrahydrofolate reductase (NADPH)
LFYNWVAECRSAGIDCLIIPGIMPILGYDRFQRMLKFTKTKVPEEIFTALEKVKADDEQVQEYGI